MSIGNALVSTVIRTGKMRPFIDAGMDRAWLKTAEAKAVIKGDDYQIYGELLDYYAKHGKVNEDVFRQSHPKKTYPLDATDWKHQEVVEQVRKSVSRWLMLDILNVADDLDDDLDDAVATFLDHADRLRGGVLRGQESTGVELLNAPDFDTFINSFTEQGIPFGIKEIDDAYGGGQPGQLITLVGRQKSTKSTLMAWSAIAAWQDDYELVFYNVELDMHFMRQKLLSIGAHVNPERMRRGPSKRKDGDDKTWAAEKERLRKFYSTLDDLPFRIAQKFSRFTVADVARDIDTFRPHAVYIDGFYFMEDAEGDSAAANHKAIENIAADLKALAMKKSVTIYVSTQAQEKQQGRKKGPGIEARTIQGGTGLLKASDLVLGIDTDEAKHVYINQIHNRFGQIDPVEINWDWEVMQMKVSEVDFDSFDL
jgi:DnaB-like helicase C terminal domain